MRSDSERILPDLVPQLDIDQIKRQKPAPRANGSKIRVTQKFRHTRIRGKLQPLTRMLYSTGIRPSIPSDGWPVLPFAHTALQASAPITTFRSETVVIAPRAATRRCAIAPSLGYRLLGRLLYSSVHLHRHSSASTANCSHA